MAAREILYMVEETSFGTTKTSPSLGTHACYQRLDRDNTFGVIEQVPKIAIPYGGGVAIRAESVNDMAFVQGSFSFILYPGIFSAHLLKWALTPINSGRTTPWTTTDSAGVMPVGDLASMCFYHAILQEDGATYTRTRYAGCKCQDITITAAAQGDARVWRVSGTLVGQRPVGNAWDSSSDPDATEFPLPAETNYPTGPYTFGHLATGSATVTLGSSSGTNRAATCAAASLTVRNQLDIAHFTSRFPARINYFGRDVTAQFGLLYKVSPDDRASHRALTAQTVTLKIDNGVNSLQFALNGNNVIEPWARDLRNANIYMQQISYANQWSPGAANDLAFTAA